MFTYILNKKKTKILFITDMRYLYTIHYILLDTNLLT